MKPLRRSAQRVRHFFEPFRLDAITTILAAIVVLGLCVRLAGIAFGLPFHHHWDEGWITDSVAGMLRHHDIVPASYQYGEPLMLLTKWGFEAWRLCTRADDDVTTEDAHVTLYLVARTATALLSTTGIVAIYVAAHHAAPETATRGLRALAAALLYAASSELVFQSRYTVTDASLVAMTAWTLAFATLYVTKGDPLYGFLAAGAAGVTFAFKMPGIVTAVIPVTAAGIMVLRDFGAEHPKRAHRVLLFAVVPIVVASYVLLNPHVIDRHHAAFHDLTIRYKQTRDGGFPEVYLRAPGLPHLASAIVAIVTAFASRNPYVATLISAVAALGCIQDLRRRNAATAVGVVYATVLVLSVAIPNRTFLYRNYLVVIDVLALGFGAGLAYLAQAARRHRERLERLGQGACTMAISVLVAALVALPIHDAWGAHASRLDPRAQAFEWIASHAESGGTVAATRTVFGKDALASYGQLAKIEAPLIKELAASDLDACPDSSSGPTYVVDASYRDPKLAPPTDPAAEQWLFEACPGYQEVARFSPSPYEADLNAYPTWLGRVTAIVLQRTR